MQGPRSSHPLCPRRRPPPGRGRQTKRKRAGPQTPPTPGKARQGKKKRPGSDVVTPPAPAAPHPHAPPPFRPPTFPTPPGAEGGGHSMSGVSETPTGTVLLLPSTSPRFQGPGMGGTFYVWSHRRNAPRLCRSTSASITFPGAFHTTDISRSAGGTAYSRWRASAATRRLCRSSSAWRFLPPFFPRLRTTLVQIFVPTSSLRTHRATDTSRSAGRGVFNRKRARHATSHL